MKMLENPQTLKPTKLVYIRNEDRTPLMPCTPVIARLLLKEGKAHVVSRVPFTLQLRARPGTEYVQPLTLAGDAGSVILGTGVTDHTGNVYYMSEVALRTDITRKMTRRRRYRRARRYRKCRYRKPRFKNRKKSRRIERFAPSVQSKIEAHVGELDYVKQLLPITEVLIEIGNFDLHAIKNPVVLKHPELYQKGLKYGFYNTKAYVLHRDEYTCQNCLGYSKDQRLNCHYIIFKEHGGSDAPENLLVMCKTCHEALHAGKITLTAKGKKQGELKHAAHMNVIRTQVLKRTRAMKTFGYITKAHREALGLKKSHVVDALVIASRGRPLTFKTETFVLKKCIPRGDYQQTKGVRSQQRIPTGKISEFRKFDKVQYRGGEYFLQGRMSTGYALLMDIQGRKQVLSPIPKMAEMRRVAARSSQLVMERSMQLTPKGASFLEQE